ncbi:hypothetical protein ACYSNU_03820 [Enterococcus sp. LJL120]
MASEYFDMNFWSGGDSYVGTDFVALVEQVGELYVIPKEDLTAGLEKLARPRSMPIKKSKFIIR